MDRPTRRIPLNAHPKHIRYSFVGQPRRDPLSSPPPLAGNHTQHLALNVGPELNIDLRHSSYPAKPMTRENRAPIHFQPPTKSKIPNANCSPTRPSDRLFGQQPPRSILSVNARNLPDPPLLPICRRYTGTPYSNSTISLSVLSGLLLPVTTLEHKNIQSPDSPLA